MRRRSPPATGVDAIESEPALCPAGRVATAVVLRQQFDVLVMVATIDVVLDPEVGEMDAVVEVRQIVSRRPSTDVGLVSVRSSVAVGPPAIAVLQERLIFALQVLFEDDAVNLGVVVLLPDPRLFFAVGGV